MVGKSCPAEHGVMNVSLRAYECACEMKVKFAIGLVGSGPGLREQ